MVPDGTVLARATSTMWGSRAVVSCSPRLGDIVYSGIGVLDARYNTYPTAIAGIGLRVGENYGGGDRWWHNLVDSSSAGAAGLTFMPQYTFVVELVKTGPITASGTLSGDIAQMSLPLHNRVAIKLRLAGSASVRPLVPSCRLDKSDIKVNLKSVSLASLERDGVSMLESFNIGLQCSGGTQGATTRMFITLTDAANPGNRSDILNLSSTSEATGIGIRILRADNTPVFFGPDSEAAGTVNQWQVGEFGNSSVIIPLSAQYVRTSGPVTPGSANGAATFTLSYQ